MSDAQWVRENLPTCANLAASFKAEFGEVRLTYASEAGYVLGKESDLAGVRMSETVVGRMFPVKPAGPR